MGLKWFRARLSMSRKSKGLSHQPEFYRSMSQFDGDFLNPVQQSSNTRENSATSDRRSSPTPGNLTNNPMGALQNSEIHDGDKFKASATRDWQPNSDDEETPEGTRKIPRHLPRESIELMRRGSADDSPGQMTIKSRKADFKKKKPRAPMPKTMINGLEDSHKNMPIEKGKGSDGNEMEI